MLYSQHWGCQNMWQLVPNLSKLAHFLIQNAFMIQLAYLGFCFNTPVPAQVSLLLYVGTSANNLLYFILFLYQNELTYWGQAAFVLVIRQLSTDGDVCDFGATTLGRMTASIITNSIVILSMAIRIWQSCLGHLNSNKSWNNDRSLMLSVTFKPIMLSVIMLNVVMQSVIVLNVVMQSGMVL